MAETSKILPGGRERYATSLVQTGISRELAYTLAEDVSAMAEASIDGKFAAQNRLIEGLINAQTAKIDAQTAVIKSQNVAIEAVTRLVIKNGEEIKASEARQTDALRSLEKRQTDALKSLEKRQTDAMRSLEKRQTDALESLKKHQTDALESLEKRQTDAMRSLEARFETHHGRLLGHHIKILWTILGAALLWVLAAAGDWAKDLLGP